MTKAYKATLIRGETYYFGEKRFERNKPQIVDAVTKAKLEKNAVDRLTTMTPEGKEVTVRAKFKFEQVAVSAAGNKGADAKAKELEAMQTDGGVSFEDDAADDAAEDGADEGDDTPEETPAPRRNARGATGRRK